MQAAEHSQTEMHSIQPRWISDELALGDKLNQAIQQNKRADFGYLLAMLSDNVLEQGFARLQRVAADAPEWKPPFAYGPAIPLAASASDYAHNPAALYEKSAVSWRLQNALRPEALNPVNDAKHIPAEVKNNCSHFVQLRMRSEAYQQVQGSEADLIDVIDNIRGVDRYAA